MDHGLDGRCPGGAHALPVCSVATITLAHQSVLTLATVAFFTGLLLWGHCLSHDTPSPPVAWLTGFSRIVLVLPAPAIRCPKVGSIFSTIR